MDDEYKKKTMETFQISDDDMQQEEKKKITGEIEHDEVGQKFFIDYGDDEAVLAYMRINDVIEIQRVVVPEQQQGHGVAGSLVLAAFEYAKNNGLKVMPTCPYVKDTFLKKHPEWNRIVVEDYF